MEKYNQYKNAYWLGLGAIHGIEGFGDEYDLPNKEAYNETCAAIANVFFNYKMFLRYGDAKYFDVAEVALFNNSLAGVNLSGDRFFYVNPLESDGHHLFNHGNAGRALWFDCLLSIKYRKINTTNFWIYVCQN